MAAKGAGQANTIHPINVEVIHQEARSRVQGGLGQLNGPNIRLGDTEVWEITNPTSQAHPFHVHGDSFQVLSRDGLTPPENELGWKDVVLVRPNETVRIIKRFRDYGDAVNPFMFHCHILEHEDVGMMGQFVVEVTP